MDPKKNEKRWFMAIKLGLKLPLNVFDTSQLKLYILNISDHLQNSLAYYSFDKDENANLITLNTAAVKIYALIIALPATNYSRLWTVRFPCYKPRISWSNANNFTAFKLLILLTTQPQNRPYKCRAKQTLFLRIYYLLNSISEANVFADYTNCSNCWFGWCRFSHPLIKSDNDQLRSPVFFT